MKEYTAETIEKTIAARDRAPHALRELLRSYMGIRATGLNIRKKTACAPLYAISDTIPILISPRWIILRQTGQLRSCIRCGRKK